MKILAFFAAAFVATTSSAAAETRTGMTRIDIDTEIVISAPVETVWAVLSDIDAYAEWNPYHVSVSGKLQEGSELSLDILKPNGKAVHIKPHVLEIDPHRSLVWGGGPRWIFRGEHRFDLEPLGATCTRLRHTEVFAGLFVRAAKLGSIEEGYVQMNEALKRRVEAESSGVCGN